MLLPSSNVDIIPLPHEGLGVDELNITAIRDNSISTLLDLQHLSNYTPRSLRCPECKFEWREWIKPSIIFVSLSLVTDACPNCRRKHVPACRMGLSS
jgi:hypothetical protein